MMRKRTKHEYRLKRRVRTKQDYLDYIQYETDVLALINVRRKVSW